MCVALPTPPRGVKKYTRPSRWATDAIGIRACVVRYKKKRKNTIYVIRVPVLEFDEFKSYRTSFTSIVQRTNSVFLIFLIFLCECVLLAVIPKVLK